MEAVSPQARQEFPLRRPWRPRVARALSRARNDESRRPIHGGHRSRSFRAPRGQGVIQGVRTALAERRGPGASDRRCASTASMSSTPTASPAGSSIPTTTRRPFSSARTALSAPATPPARRPRRRSGPRSTRTPEPPSTAPHPASGRIAVKVINHLGDETKTSVPGVIWAAGQRVSARRRHWRAPGND